MRLTLEALVVLDAIERRGSFAGAAEELHRVPSAVTYAVQKIEDELDVLLFDRSGHRARLTEAGRELLREGRYLLGAAAELEQRVKRMATGFEVELRIGMTDLVPLSRMFPLVEEFYGLRSGTRLKLSVEVFGGLWDALATGRVDLAVGAPGEGPPGGGYAVHEMARLKSAFMVAPVHPLARASEPLEPEDILPHRAVVAADSSRNLPARTAGLLSGQDVLTLPDVHHKIAAQIAGLGSGYLPLHLTREHVARGRLIVKKVREPCPPLPVYLAWPTTRQGKALAWFVERLRDPSAGAALFG
jgi:DNA-binding transcriptional LysR family regulator